MHRTDSDREINQTFPLPSFTAETCQPNEDRMFVDSEHKPFLSPSTGQDFIVDLVTLLLFRLQLLPFVGAEQTIHLLSHRTLEP